MSGYLIDTNILSELRRPKRALPVVDWFGSVEVETLFISVLTLGELRRGIEQLRPKDPTAASALDRWLAGVRTEFSDRILAADQAVAEQWGRLSVGQPLPSIDGLLAATALVHQLTVVTRNTADFERSGAACLNPFEFTA
ncbi:MAG: type II toxin-antitoxin system VapC family toxin [Verrucomicrobiota bacterium]